MKEPDCGSRTLNLCGSERNTIPWLQNLICASRLPVDANQIVLGTTIGKLFLEQFRDGNAVADFDMVGEAAAVVIDQKNFQLTDSLRMRNEASSSISAGSDGWK